jgi:hypothetical protein
MSGPGFFYSPEDQDALTQIQRRQQYARALMSQGMEDPGHAAYGGLRNAGNSILGAFLANKADKSETGLAKSASDRYTQGLASLLGGNQPSQTPATPPPAASTQPSPQISNSAGSGPIMPNGGATSPQGAIGGQQAPVQPQASSQPPMPAQPVQPSQDPLQRLVATGNPALMAQFGPSMLNHQIEINDQKVTPISPQDATAMGLRPGGLYGRNNATGNIVQIQASDLKSQGAIEQDRGEKTFENQLPLTPAQRAANQLGYAQINKPQMIPYGTPGYLQGGKYVALPGGGAGTSPFGNGDPKATSLQGQLGISTAGLNYLLGNTSQLGMRDKQTASKEVDSLVARTGLDQSTLKAKAQAYSSAVNMNTLKSNTMDTLSNELKGTIANLAPVADNLGGGRLRWVKGAAQFAGGLENDPNAQQYAYYLSQLRADLAGFNAVSGGKIGMHGQVQTDNADFAIAEKVIKDGLDRGGANGLLQAVEATRQKNVAIVQHQSEEAQRGIWNALGLGKNYDAVHPNAAPAPDAGGGGNPVPLPAGWSVKVK